MAMLALLDLVEDHLIDLFQRLQVMALMARLAAWLFPARLAQALLLTFAKPVGRGRKMAVMVVFDLLFLEGFDLILEGFDLVPQLFGRLEGLFESLLQRVALLFEQLHLLLFDGSCLSQKEVLVSQAF